MPPPPSIIILFVCLIFETATNNSVPNPKCLDRNGTLDTPGWTIPRGDIELEVGTPLEIYCMLDSTNTLTQNYTARDIVFQKASRKVDSQYVTVVNATAARLYMETLNSSVGTEYVYCNLNLRGKDVATFILSANTSSLEMPSTTEKMICSNAVTLGCKPQNVSNVSCIEVYGTGVTCTWIEPNNGVKTNYSVFYRHLVGLYGTWKHFPCQAVGPGRCWWSFWNSEVPVVERYDHNWYYLRVYGANKFDNTVQIIPKISRWENVIPEKYFGKFKLLDSTTHSLYLSVGPQKPPSQAMPMYIFRAHYTWSNSEFWITNEYNSSNYHSIYEGVLVGDSISFNVTNLPYPNVAYNFTISRRNELNSYWSEPSDVYVVRTSPCAPYRSPKTDLSGFEILMPSQLSQSRDVMIYWEHLPDVEQNGDNFTYEVVAFKDDVKVDVKPRKVEKTYARFNNLSFNSYTFVIRSINKMGSAPHTSEVKLPRHEDVLSNYSSTLLTLINFGDGVYKLLWMVPNAIETNKTVSNYTVSWCENSLGYPYPCANTLNWLHVSVDTFQHMHNFTTKPSKLYLFGISVNSINSSSGIMWAKCMVPSDRVNKIKNVKPGNVGSTYIELSWILDCEERVEDIQGYNVTFCPIVDNRCAEPLKTNLMKGDVTTDRGSITGLTPFTKYKISVAIFTSKLLGEASEWLSIQTQEGAPNMTDVKVAVTNTTNTTAFVRWTAPSNPNGILDHYKVYYEHNNMVLVNKTFIELTELRSYDTYHIQVVACTKDCSMRTDPVALHTKIGNPSEVRNILAENENTADIKLKWEPPAVPAGPNLVYNVKVEANEPESTSNIREFETNKTEMLVESPCDWKPSYLAYNIFIRARNIDNSDSNIGPYDGPWLSARTVDCPNNAGLPIMYQIIFFVLLCALSSVVVFFSKKGCDKLQGMRNVQVVIPSQFGLTPLDQEKIQNVDYRIDMTSCTDPDKTNDSPEIDGSAEIDDSAEINDSNKFPDADQSSINCTDLDLDADRESSQSSSGCYSS